SNRWSRASSFWAQSPSTCLANRGCSWTSWASCGEREPSSRKASGPRANCQTASKDKLLCQGESNSRQRSLFCGQTSLDRNESQVKHEQDRPGCDGPPQLPPAAAPVTDQVRGKQ